MTLEKIEKAFKEAYIGGIDSENPAHLQDYAMKLVAVAKAAKLRQEHQCGLLDWSGECTACNGLKEALEDLEKE